MREFNQLNQGKHRPVPAQTETLSVYEKAVLSTLFEQEDYRKLIDLAKQWGYEQEFLQACWCELHRVGIDH